MTLAVDIGNTSICLGVFDNGERLVFRAKLASDHRKSADEYAVLISGVFRMHGADLSTIERAVMLSVVPALTHTVCEALGVFGIKPLIVGSGVKTGLCLRVDTPNLLGTDIVADTVAAMRIAEPPMIVIDLGTATTITVINEKGELCGCVISPGVKLGQDALAEKCALLPEVSLSAPPRVVGRNTADSVNSGIVLGTALMLDGFISRISREMGFEKPSVIATGGLAHLIVPLSENDIIVEPDLTLRGLAHISELNQRKK